MRRVSVIGNSGSGKTTAARALARKLEVPFIELDAIFHQPGWEPLPAEEFRRRTGAWTRHELYRERFAALSTDPAYSQITFIRVRSRAHLASLLA